MYKYNKMKTENKKENETNCECVKSEEKVLPQWLSKVIAVCGMLSMMYVVFSLVSNKKLLKGGGGDICSPKWPNEWAGTKNISNINVSQWIGYFFDTVFTIVYCIFNAMYLVGVGVSNCVVDCVVDCMNECSGSR